MRRVGVVMAACIAVLSSSGAADEAEPDEDVPLWDTLTSDLPLTDKITEIRLSDSWLSRFLFVDTLTLPPLRKLFETKPLRPRPGEPFFERYLLFSGIDLWRGGGFAHHGLLWSPMGIDAEGFTLKAMSGVGAYPYRSGTKVVGGRQLVTSFMPGWRYKSGAFEATVFAGVDQQLHWSVPYDPGRRLHGFYKGFRFGTDLWWHPKPGMMVAASLSISSIGHSYWLRAATGWRAFDMIYVGPEAQFYRDDDYAQTRLGVHATALTTGQLEWSAGTGWARDADRNGLYGRLGMVWRR